MTILRHEVFCNVVYVITDSKTAKAFSVVCVCVLLLF